MPNSYRSSLVLGSILALLAVAMPLAAQAPAATGLKVFIAVDMEGVAGAVTADQMRPPGFEYERFRQFMTLQETTQPLPKCAR